MFRASVQDLGLRVYDKGLEKRRVPSLQVAVFRAHG